MFPSELTASRSAPLQREGEGEGQEGVGRARLAASALQPHRSPLYGTPQQGQRLQESRRPGAKGPKSQESYPCGPPLASVEPAGRHLKTDDQVLPRDNNKLTLTAAAPFTWHLLRAGLDLSPSHPLSHASPQDVFSGCSYRPISLKGNRDSGSVTGPGSHS